MNISKRFSTRGRGTGTRMDFRHKPPSAFQEAPLQKRHLKCPNHKPKVVNPERRHFAPRGPEPVKRIKKKPLSPRNPRRPEGRAHLRWTKKSEERQVFNGHRRVKPGHRETSEVHNLEKMMGAKRRVPSRISKRNGLMDRSQGDKPYSHVEYSENYFQKRGLVPQIELDRTLGRRTMLNAKKGGRFETKRLKSYSEVTAEQRHKAEQEEVANLPSIPCEGNESDDGIGGN
eukprot:jgi/Bigna1/146767/aug1.120_g21475